MAFPVSRFIRPLAGLLLAAVAGAAAAQSASPNGTIAYTVCDWSDVTFDFECDIWTMNGDGTGQANITNTPETSETGPVWSPDGTRIAFSRAPASAYESEMWVMNADGGNQIKFSPEPDWQFGPSWSPGGTQIAYVKNVPGEFISDQFDIFVHDLDTGTEVNLTRSDADELEPAWSPDGALIAFAGVRQTRGFFGAWEIVTMTPTGQDEKILTVRADGNSYEDRDPSWSPDGSMLVFMSQYNESCCGPWDIYAMNRDGSGITALTTDNPADDMFPTWSPDGTQILFSSTRDGNFGERDLYSMAAPTVLPPESAAAKRRIAEAARKTRRLTNNGISSDADWGPQPRTIGDPFGLYVAIAGAGKVSSEPAGVSCGKDCSEIYPFGTEVVLRALPKPGHRFAGWFGACSGQQRECRVTVNDVSSVVARFKPRSAE